MNGMETALVTSWAGVTVFAIYAFGWRAELNAYRRNEQAKKEITENDSLEGRLIRSSNAYHKFE